MGCQLRMAFTSSFDSAPAGVPQTKKRVRPGLGLIAMRERAELVGGKITISSTPGEGTMVSLVMPLRQEDRQPEILDNGELEEALIQGL